MSGISITCFAASYAVALALEITRLFFRSGVRGAVMLLFAGAGLLAHSLFLVYRALHEPNAPLSSEFDWYLIAAWCLMLAYFDLTTHHPKTPFGLFVLPLVLGLIGMAQFVADRTPFPRTEAAQVWGSIHGAFLLLGTVAVFIGFVVGVMALAQAYRLKHKLSPSQGLKLPSLEWLERLNARAIVVSVIMLAIGFLSGIVLNVLHDRLHVAEVPWNDPIVWTSALPLIWMLAAAGFSVLYKPARQGRKVAYLTVASFVFLVLCVGLRLLLPTQHGAAHAPPPKPATSQRPQRPERWRAADHGLSQRVWQNLLLSVFRSPAIYGWATEIERRNWRRELSLHPSEHEFNNKLAAGKSTGGASGTQSERVTALERRSASLSQQPSLFSRARGGS